MISCIRACVRNLTTSDRIVGTVGTNVGFQSLSCRSANLAACKQQFPSTGTSTGAKPSDNNFAAMSSLAFFVEGTLSQFPLNFIILAVFPSLSRVLLIKWRNGKVQSVGTVVMGERPRCPPAITILPRFDMKHLISNDGSYPLFVRHTCWQ